MISNGSHDRQSTASRTKMAQAGAVVAIMAGGALAIFGLPGFKTDALPELEPVPPVKATETTDDSGNKSDLALGAVADRLALVSNRPIKPVVATPPPTEQTPVEVPPAPTDVQEVRYLGSADMGALKLALLFKNEAQHWVALGGQLGDDKVKQISATQITLQNSSGERTIDIAPRATELFTRASTGAAAGNPFNPTGNRARPTTNRPPTPNQLGLRGQRGGGRATPAPVPASLSMGGNYQHIFNDPAKTARFEQIKAKLRDGGEYQGEGELNEAAAKYTDQEFSIPDKKGDK